MCEHVSVDCLPETLPNEIFETTKPKFRNGRKNVKVTVIILMHEDNQFGSCSWALYG